MKKTFLLTALLCCLFNVALAQSSLKVRLENKSFEQLYLAFVTHGGKQFTYSGKTTDGENWQLNYADSIYDRATMMQIVVPSTIDSIYHILIFSDMINGKMATSPQIYFCQNDSVVMKYVEQKVSVADPFYGFLTVIADKFTIENSSGKFYIAPYALENIYNPNLSAAANIAKLSAYVKNNPDSRYALVQLAKALHSLGKTDIKPIFESFSTALQKSYFGNIVNKYLTDDTFANLQLPDSKTGSEQWVVQADKPTLVIFSASWCAPCHKAIPIYKEIFAEIGDKIDMVYLTIDEADKVKVWNKLIKKENIEWRSLSAAKAGAKIMSDYYISGIPYSLLVMPDKSIVRLDVRDEKEREQLLNLCNSAGKE